MKVRDLVIPVDRHPVVSEEATLAEVFLALESALQAGGDGDAANVQSFAVLVLDRRGGVVGKLSVWDVLRGLEPQARRRVDALAMVEGYDAWDRPLEHLASKVETLRARDVVEPLPRKEYIDEEAGLDEALRRLVDNGFLFLVARRGRETVGILRLVDVFAHVCDRLRARSA